MTIFGSLVLAALCAWQAEQPAPQPAPGATPPGTPASTPIVRPTLAEIQQAVVDLGSEKIIVRERASQRLWEAGLAAEPALKKAAGSNDAEVRYRARAILERFKYGVYADTPPDIVALIQQFRNADQNGRSIVLQQLADRKQFATMFQLIANEGDAAQRLALINRFVQDPAGAVGRLIVAGQFVEAEQLLEYGLTHDQGMIGYTTFLAVRGQLDERIAKARADFANGANPPAGRLLVYLLRAKGDLAAARKAAQALGDRPLERAVLIEQRDWPELARRAAEFPPTLPFDAAGMMNFPPESQRIEQLGFEAAFRSRARDADGLSKLVAELKKQAADAAKTSNTKWNCVEALAIADRPVEALELLRDANPVAAFDWLAYQHRYDEAFDFVNFAPGMHLNKDWFVALPVEAPNNVQLLLTRFRLALYVARVLHTLGMKDDESRVYALLEAMANEPKQQNEYYSKAQLWLQMAQMEYRSGRLDKAFEHASLAAQEGDGLQGSFYQLFGTRNDEAIAWASVVGTKGNRSNKETLQALHRLLVTTPAADEKPEEFREWIDAAIAYAATLDANAGPLLLARVGQTCVLRNQPQLARKCFERGAEGSTIAALRLADLNFEEQKWDDAIKYYDQVAARERTNLLAQYLGGLAREKAGKADEGKKLKLQANLLALGGNSRHQMALGLQQRGHLAEARGQWELVFRTAPFESWELIDGARLMGELLENEDAARTADLWDLHMLADLRLRYNFIDYESYLRYPFQVHKMRAQAAIGKKDFVEARREIEVAWIAAPHDVRLAEDLVPLIREAGGDEANKLATELFDRQFKLLDAVVQRYPDGAFHRNNLAWLAARCHEHLDEALAHAERAVKLAPDNPSYIDTLAEVHFHRGNRDEALKLERRAVEMAPKNKTFREQLARFESAPLPGAK